MRLLITAPNWDIKLTFRKGIRTSSNLQADSRTNQWISRASVITIGEGFLIDKDTPFGKILAHSFEAVYQTVPVYFFASGFSDGGNMLSGGMTDVFNVGAEGFNIHNANECVIIESVDISETLSFDRVQVFEQLK